MAPVTFRQTIECGFTLKLVRDMIITYCEICRNNYRKTLVLGALFNKAAGVKACNVIKKRLQHRCFAMNIAKSLRTAFYRTPFVGCFRVLVYQVTLPKEVVGTLFYPTTESYD